jgi:hypothetical protein
MGAFTIFDPSKTDSMNKLLIRIAAILVHAAANFLLITWLTNFDISGSWLAVGGFIILLAILLLLFIKHILSFIYFLKKQPK